MLLLLLLLFLLQNLIEVMTTGLRQLVDNRERMFEQIKLVNVFLVFSTPSLTPSSIFPLPPSLPLSVSCKVWVY